MPFAMQKLAPPSPLNFYRILFLSPNLIQPSYNFVPELNTELMTYQDYFRQADFNEV